LRGVLKMLDDECLVGQGSDSGFANKLYQQLGGGSMGRDAASSHARFSASHTQRVENLFEVSHYAGAVVYSTFGFIEKNKDTLFPEVGGGRLLFVRRRVCSRCFRSDVG
jgi:myosin heavy subunit